MSKYQDGKKKRRIMRKLVINRLSAVDRPAQEGALALLMKRADEFLDPALTAEELEQSPIEKRLRLLSDENGHSHLIEEDEEGGHTSHDQADGAEFGHSHPWVRNDDGTISIGAADGHTHKPLQKSIDKRKFTADQRRKLADRGLAMPDGSFPIENKGDLRNAVKAFGRAKDKGAAARFIVRRARSLGAMDLLPGEGLLADIAARKAAGDGDNGGQTVPNEPKAADIQAVEKRVTELETELETSKAYGQLTDAQKAHYDGLDETARGEFLKLSPEARASVIEKIQADDPVVYTSDDGTEFRKSHDPALVNMAKGRDEDRRELRKQREENERQRLEKRAGDELSHLPGDTVVKVAALRAVEGIEDKDQREGVEALLRAADATAAKSFETIGTRQPSDETDEVEAIAKNIRDKDPNLTPEQAYAKALETPEGLRAVEASRA